MRDVQDITFNITGQTLFLDVPEGQSSSVTDVQVFNADEGDAATEEAATTGSASIDAVDTTFDANSGVTSTNPRLCNLTATTSIVADRLYLAANAAGEREWVEVQGITSGESVTSRHALYNDYVSTDTFKGTRLTISVDSTWVADTSNINAGMSPTPGYRVRWTYVVDSVTYTRYTYFNLVRQAGLHNVTVQDIDKLHPGFLYALPPEHQEDEGRGLIDEAYVQVGIDLYQEGIPDAQVRDQRIIDELVKRKAVMMWAETKVLLSNGTLEAVDVAQRDYDTRFKQLVRDPSQVKVPVAVDDTGAATIRDALRISRR